MKKIYTLAAILLMTQLSFGAELFIRVARSGSHSATAYDQTQTNSTNIFRFFDLPGGIINILVKDQQNGWNVFNGSLNIAYNQRVIAELDYNGNLQIIQTIAINTSNWYTSIPETIAYNGNPYPTNPYPYPNNNPYPNNGGYGAQNCTNEAFGQFLKLMDNEPFDSNKLTLARSYVTKTNLSAQQISDIGKTFTFDSNRLDWAKDAYAHCYDQADYFLLKSTFTFSSNYSALVEYIEGQ